MYLLRQRCFTINMCLYIILAVFNSVFLIWQVSGKIIQLTQGNIDAVLAENDVVFVNFYADWCKFSQQLKQIYADASEKFKDFPPGRIAWAEVNCDAESALGAMYSVNKYPTLKLFRHGELVKREYRAQRSVSALTEFIKQQLMEIVKCDNSSSNLNASIVNPNRNVIAYFNQLSGTEFENFKKVASLFREDCKFFCGSGSEFSDELAVGNKLIFIAPEDGNADQYPGNLTDFRTLSNWIGDKCIPLVREITFENAEELTEEGLPFLILFRAQGDTASENAFKDAVARELSDQKKLVNCLIADGERFSHPLHHLGKTISDLPIVAIDSFRHMYILGKDLSSPGTLRAFILDLHSGKLHREFHHGSDPVTSAISPILGGGTKKLDGGDAAVVDRSVRSTKVPDSVFSKLKPSETRYSILRKDEL